MKHFFFTLIFGIFLVFSSCNDDLPGSFYVSVQVSPDSAGSVIFNRGPHVEGTEITLTAVANDNYELFAWNHLRDGERLNPLTVVMNSNLNTVAIFLFIDNDKDGVGDSDDVCLNTPYGESVNVQGCSASQLDEDNDGVSDDLDQCPGTIFGEEVDEMGCGDTDGDGLSNLVDQCPYTQEAEIDNVNDSGCHIFIGAYREGGVVFYVDETNEHGLVSDIQNLGNVGIVWGCYGLEVDHSDGIAIGTGAQNTLAILADCSEDSTAAFYAANSVSQGYNDWFLPSHDELDQMHCLFEVIDSVATLNGGKNFIFDNHYGYWSSTQDDENFAYYQDFRSGSNCTNSPESYPKRYLYLSVRAARAF